MVDADFVNVRRKMKMDTGPAKGDDLHKFVVDVSNMRPRALEVLAASISSCRKLA